ncbi:hypothetical protein ACP0HM_30430 [Escherichia coli]
MRGLIWGLMLLPVKSYVSSALTTTLFGSGVGEREVGVDVNHHEQNAVRARMAQFSVEVDGLEGQTSLPKTLPTTITASNMKRLKSAEGISFNQRSVRPADNNDGQGYR